MSLIPFIAIVIALLLAGGAFLFYKRRKRNRAIAEVLSKDKQLGHWTYSDNEWQQAVADEFNWARASDGGGEVFFTPDTIYIRSNSSDHLIELSGDRVVTHASYRGTEGSSLKIRVRWKVIQRNADNTQQQTKYFKEDYRIPVPLRERETAKQIAAWFTARCEKNMEVYADFVGEDESISIFGNDSF